MADLYEWALVGRMSAAAQTDTRRAVGETAAERAARRVRDKLFSLWIGRAPRFGAVAAHFPRSLRCRRFVASFWAPEVFFSGPWPASSYTEERFGWYANGGTRAVLDFCISHAIDRARWPLAPRLFWSPELPEVRVNTEGSVRGVYALRSATARRLEPNWPWELVAAFLILLCLALPASAQTLFGTVSRVTDGDTLVIGRTRIRLFGIDAPEGKQECREADRRPYHCGNRARAALERLAPAGSSISCRVKDTDRYGRLVAVCSVAQRAGSDLSREMVAAGWAVAFRKYSTKYVPEEDAARTARRGLWSGSFERPDDWRRAH